MNEIIEKVAQAIAEAEGFNWICSRPDHREPFLNQARAAILAYEVARREAIEAQMREAFK